MCFFPTYVILHVLQVVHGGPPVLGPIHTSLPVNTVPFKRFIIFLLIIVKLNNIHFSSKIDP